MYSQETLPDAEKDIYLRFIDWLKQSWYGAPGSDTLISYVITRYTPEEAAFLTGMPFSPKNLEELSAWKKMDIETVRKMLNNLTARGLVYHTVKDGKDRYHLNDIFFVYRTFGWPGRTDEYSKKVGPHQSAYFTQGLLDPWKNVKEKGLRVLPIDTTIEDTHEILPYEEVRKILDSVEYFTVSHCPCRHANNLNPDTPDCKYPTEVCLHFDKLGHYIVENGLGREITRQETEDILKQCAELGLVHGIANQQEKPDTICNCCKCCCIWFTCLYKLKHSGSLNPSNFRIHAIEDTCTGCGLCVKRCPMEAVHLKELATARGRKISVTEKDGRQRELTNKTGKVAEVKSDLCIGCGVCAYKCPSRSLVLARREIEHHPPQTGRDWMVQFINDRNAALE